MTFVIEEPYEIVCYDGWVDRKRDYSLWSYTDECAEEIVAGTLEACLAAKRLMEMP
jgi:hypothetical protein